MRATTGMLVAGAALAATLASACGTTGTAGKTSGDSAEDKAGEDSPAAVKTGRPAEDGKFTFVVTGVSTRTDRIGDEYAGKDPQGKFVLVKVKVTNHGKEAQTFFGSDQKLLASDKEYSADDEAAVYLPSSRSLYEQINPGNKVKGTVVFDVPEDVKPESIELHDSAFSNGVRVSLK